MMKPILVTGIHFSGTTWLGKIIASAPGVAFVWEPFNIRQGRPGVCASDFRFWYMHISEENSEQYIEGLADTLAFKYNYPAEIAALGSAKDTARMVRDASRFLWFRMWGHRPLMKDPMALLSAEWLQETFDMKVVLIIRHPAAFAAAVKQRGHSMPFDHFLKQPVLLSNPLAKPFVEQIHSFASSKHDPVDQAAFFWCILATFVRHYQERHDDWVFLRHEDLLMHPKEGFKKVFDRLSLPFTESTSRFIRSTTSSSNPTDTPKKSRFMLNFQNVYVHRNTKAIFGKWKNELTEEEKARIFEIVKPVARYFYSDDSWV